MSLRRPPIPVVFRLLAGPLLLLQGGCMSALTTAAMREALRETVDSVAAVTASDAAGSDRNAEAPARVAADESTPLISEPKAPSLDESVNQAIARLKDVGELDAQTQATLLSILEKTSPEDWPAAIDAFAASLEAYRPPPRATTPAATQPPAQVAHAEPVATPAPPASAPTDEGGLGSPAEPAAVTVIFEPPAAQRGLPTTEAEAEGPLVFPGMPVTPEPARLAVVDAARPVGLGPDESEEHEFVSAAGATPQPSVAPERLPKPVLPQLSVRNASFVSHVRTWGVVKKFPEAVFRPGQDVIVYFEIDELTSRQSPAGHSTSVDTTLQLFDTEGRQIGEWNFEPIEETCLTPRRDYFARYFVRIPETAVPGSHRLELMVTDLFAGVSGRTHLDLEVRQ